MTSARALGLAALLALLPAPAQAAQRPCVQREVTAPVTGVLRATLDGSPHGTDWDLRVFDAGGRLLGASLAFGANEVVSTPVAAGGAVTVRACRHDGAGQAPPLRVEHVVPAGPVATPTLSLVSVRFRGRRDLDRLLALGFDLNETARGGRVDAVLHGSRDVRRLRAAGFAFRTKIADLRAFDRRALRPRARSAQAAALPSGRTAYRSLADYEADMKALVEQNPGLVRPVILPRTSVEGRTIAGIEIANDVERTDDGRPVHVQFGLHHVREWPSGEVVMEFGIDLVNNRADPEIDGLLRSTRTVLFPVVNPDGLVVSQAAGTATTPADDDAAATLPLAAAGAGAYRRKNCAPAPGEAALPCPLRSGVDLNRNYGAFWGGPGAATSWSDQTFRGPAPFSEPEAQGVREWSSRHQLMVVNSNHTYARTVLYQPGFSGVDEPGLPAGTKLPYESQMITLGTAMAQAAGYTPMYSYALYDVTGATEDWNYFAQGAFGYTTEIGAGNFHPNHQDGVVEEYLGTREDQPSQGLRKAMLIAGAAAADPANHAIITGSAPAGRTLRLRKDFSTTTSYVEGSADGAALLLPEHLESTLTVGTDGHYRWHVNPSTRPLELLAGRTEAWTLECLAADGALLQTRQVEVKMGETAAADLACDGTSAPTVHGAPTGAAEKTRLTIRGVSRRGRRVVVRLRTTAPVTRLRATLRDRRGRTRAARSRERVSRTARIVLRARKPLRGGRYTVRVSARDAASRVVRAQRALRVRR